MSPSSFSLSTHRLLKSGVRDVSIRQDHTRTSILTNDPFHFLCRVRFYAVGHFKESCYCAACESGGKQCLTFLLMDLKSESVEVPSSNLFRELISVLMIMERPVPGR